MRVQRPLALLRAGAMVVALASGCLTPVWAQQPAAARPKPVTTKPASPKPPTGAVGVPALPAAPVEATRPPVPAAAAEPVKDAARQMEEVAAPVIEQVDRAKAYLLGPGDVLRVTVFQQPDMGSEGRVSEIGTYSVPLLGPVAVGGLTVRQVEAQIAYLLRRGGFVREPQVNVNILAFKSRQVSVLGYVARPGRYFLEEGVYHVTDVLALAGGTAPGASDVVILVREGRDGVPGARFEINVPGLFRAGSTPADLEVLSGDSLFVDRAPFFYIYGEVQRPGSFRLESDMTVMQALSVAGGVNVRGTVKNMQITRKDSGGKPVTFAPALQDTVKPDDVIFVRESIF
jgi:polysaccharide export outer membrane protein